MVRRKKLAEQINCRSNRPIETAIFGSIIFVKPPMTHEVLAGKDPELNRISILDTQKLLSQHILYFLKNEELLKKIELAKAVPFPLKMLPLNDKGASSYIQNYLAIEARCGSWEIILQELLAISLHPNWNLSAERKDLEDTLDAFKFATAQRTRLDQLKRREERLQNALDLLNKRYPNNTDVLEWQVNNIYTNVVRYSPLYLSWSAYLETFLQKGKNWKFWLIDRLANLDWDYLVMIGAATSDEAEKIILLTEIDGGSDLTKMRVTTEKMIQVAYKREYPTRRHPNLANMLQQLNNKHIFPSIIYVCLDSFSPT